LACTADAARSVNAATNISARMNVLTARAAPGSKDRALPKIVQRTCAACALLRVDPRLLDHERLPEARSDPLDLVVGVRLGIADGHRVRETLRVFFQVERQGHAARDVLGDHRDAVTS